MSSHLLFLPLLPTPRPSPISVCATVCRLPSLVTLPALSLSLLLSLPVSAHALPTLSPSSPPSTFSTSDRDALRAISRTNTRVSGGLANRFSLARQQEAANELDAALDTYNALIMSAPEFAPAYANRGNIYSARKQYDAALADYDRALELAPWAGDSWVVWTNRGCVKLALGRERDALGDLNVADELRPGEGVVLENRAGVWERLGKWDQAGRDYGRAIKGNDVRPFWVRYGLVLYERGRREEAVGVLRRVESRYEVDDVHAALAVVLWEGGDVEGGESEWSKVQRPGLWGKRQWIEEERHWPPRAVDAMMRFRGNKQK